MRLTLVISSLGFGGAERVLTSLANCWAEQGREVSLLTFEPSDASSAAYPIHPSVKVRRLGLAAVSAHLVMGLLRNLWRIRVLRRAIRESHSDVVISFMNSTNILTLAATRWLGTPVIISERADPLRHDIGPLWSFLRRIVYPFADALVCQTSSALIQFQSMTKVRGFVIPNLVAKPFIFDDRNVRHDARAAGHSLVAMGRLAPQKGFDLLLNVFSFLADSHPDWSLTVIGDGPLRNELETQAKALKLTNRVHFTGVISEPLCALRNADLYVLSSRFEGFPNVLCEAMACGLPVVSFDCPSGPRDIIRDGVDGILVPPEDVDALVTCLDRLMSDDQERKRLAARARDILDRFSSEKILALWEELFDEVTVRRIRSRSPDSIRAGPAQPVLRRIAGDSESVPTDSHCPEARVEE